MSGRPQGSQSTGGYQSQQDVRKRAARWLGRIPKSGRVPWQAEAQSKIAFEDQAEQQADSDLLYDS